MIVYRIARQEPAPFMVLNDDWYPAATWQNQPGRWMKDNSTIKIISPHNGTFNLSFYAGSFNQKMNLSVYINNKLIGIFSIDPIGPGNSLPTHIVMNITLNKGENILRFQAPQLISELSIADKLQGGQTIRIGFQNITLTQ
ncbi:hypothetical protein [Methanocella conradii]|uniref:hypothetical protein n=1 Tax=Methanocella conradii TaxID=1175444 RepID=UPI00157BB902|nr:hypothetical protein [Methanocella conradii]